MTAKTLMKYIVAYLNKKGDPVSNKKIQKLLYYIEAWHLVHFSNPLIDEEFEAWVYGPVLPSVYKNLKQFGFNNVVLASPSGNQMTEDELDTVIGEFAHNNDLSADQVSLIDDVLMKYGNLSSQQLELLTHSEIPWKAARGDTPPHVGSTAVIDKKLMADFYRNILDGKKS